MKIFAPFLIVCAALLLGISPAKARRGNPVFHNAPKSQYYLIDSDDDEARKPAYKFVDTLVDPTNWHRITGFTNNDDGYAFTTANDSISFVHANNTVRLPPKYVTTNGYL